MAESIDQAAKEAAISAAVDYVKSDKFKEEMSKEYKNKLVSLVKEAEKSARNMAAIPAFLIVAIFTIIMAWEYSGFSKTQNELYQSFIAAKRDIVEIENEANRIKIEIDQKKNEVSSSLTSIDSRLAATENKEVALSNSLEDLKTRVTTLNQSITRLEERYNNQVNKDASR